MSPFTKLRDLILGQNDFVKKQSDIISFCAKFTRSATPSLNPSTMSNDNQHWLYCIETNLKLLPNFLLILARVFSEKGDYNNELSKICSTQGKLSDDGESWVDAHSGYVIKKIEFSSEEGYDESGFKSQSRDQLQADMADRIITSEDSDSIFEDPNAQIASNIISALSTYMGINIESNRQWIIKHSLVKNYKTLPSKVEYERKAEILLKSKNKTLPNYNDAFISSLLLFTLAYYHIGVQISIPNVKTRKRFPGCVKSFEGFPLEGTTNVSGLSYVACIANKIKSSVSPWSSIKKMNESTLLKRVKDIINKYLLSSTEVTTGIKEKLEWLSLNKGDDIPVENDIIKWNTFLPPLRRVEIKGVANISDNFRQSLLANIKTGSSMQKVRILILKTKIILFSLKIQENIQKVLDKQQPLLANSASEPFLENVCCQETFSTTIDYFMKANSDIKVSNDIVIELSNVLNDIQSVAQPVRIFDSRDTKRKYPKLATEFSERTIYRAFIYYCKFGSILPMSKLIAPICLSKPESFNPLDDLDEQIRVLKRDGKIYTTESLKQLLMIINSQNIINRNVLPEIPNPIQSIRDLLSHFVETDENYIPTGFKEGLVSVLDTYDIAMTADTQQLRSFKNYLAETNTVMRAEISTFLHKNSNLSQTKLSPVINFIETFGDWEPVSNDGDMSSVNDTSIHRVLNFISDCVYNITRVFPNIILNKVNYKQISIPRHWKLSDRHINDVKKIISGYYVSLGKFYDKEHISSILANIQVVTTNIYKIMSNIPCFSSIVDNGKTYYNVFNRAVSKLIFEFCLLQVYKHFIDLTKELSGKITIVEKPDHTMITNVQLQDAEIGNITEVEIIQGETLENKQELANFLIDVTKIFISTKKTLNYSHDSVMKKVNRSKEREKDEVTTRLKDLTDEAREIDTIFKNHKLGSWGKGLQKGLTQYVKETYDEERESLEKRTIAEGKVGEMSFVTDMNRDIYTMDYENNEAVDDEINQEVNDISMFVGEEDDYGDNDGDEGF